ncbi:RNA-guided endonuclease InsQ/TnpB family protein [Deinococcus aerolatus]|uniref:RNA-guided endonuclease InsQ/TnpB family protein n=1 Tax=Deinococcus aerolatus TaxID=522487 RepID=UPI00166AA61F|nr:RNA-guided endonuclease TnpB family protein [Deinococcus aerolatus]
MKVVRTAKLKLICSPEQKAALDVVTFAFRDAQNTCSKWAFENAKTASNKKIHDACYATLRTQHGLSSQLACSAERLVASTYKGLWTRTIDAAKRRREAVARKASGQKIRIPSLYKGLDSAPLFKARTLEYQLGRDYSFKKDQHVSLMTLEGRLSLPYVGWNRHVAELGLADTVIGAAKLWYQKSRKQWYLLVSFTVELPEPKSSDFKQVVGVDVGQRFHAVTKVNDPSRVVHAVLHSGAEHDRRKRTYERNRSNLQAKGTRSSKKRLASLSGQERRFTACTNHQLASRIIQAHPHALIGMEDLVHLRDRVERRSSNKASKKRKAANRRSSQWSYAELRRYVGYKAQLTGSLVVAVDAYMTSQTCPPCGHVSRENRPGNGVRFVCQSCGFEEHADVVGAMNIGMRASFLKQQWSFTGCLSATPVLSGDVDVPRDEVEARRAARAIFLELRWSVGTSP